MTSTFADRYRVRGTRFRVYPQLKGLRGVAAAETIYVDAAPGTIGPGPSDDRMYVVDADGKLAYDDTGERPPYRGPQLPPVVPDRQGHFDYLRPGTRAFAAASVFAVSRSVLDVWESYFGRQLRWYFARDYARLEIIPRAEFQNAVSRAGYVELGHADARRTLWFSDNFDSVAHEIGHAVVRTVVGQPQGRRPILYRAFEEACADLIATVSSLHFASVVAEVLRETQGRLFSVSLLSRIAELDRRRQVRSALGRATMRQALAARDPADPIGFKYLLARPFTGAAFEVLIELYEERLVERGAIAADVAQRSSAARARDVRDLRTAFARQFRGRPHVFREALLAARDDFGRLVAGTLDRSRAVGLSYGEALRNMIAVDRVQHGGRHAALIETAFARRGIVPSRR